jgi:hypothetical protein
MRDRAWVCSGRQVARTPSFSAKKKRGEKKPHEGPPSCLPEVAGAGFFFLFLCSPRWTAAAAIGGSTEGIRLPLSAACLLRIGFWGRRRPYASTGYCVPALTFL